MPLFLFISCHAAKDFSSYQKLGEAFEALNFKTKILSDLPLQKAFQAENSGRESYRIIAQQNAISINIDIDRGLDFENFKKYKSMIEEQFFGNFYSRFAPYPGEITKRVVCSLDFYPTAYNIVLQGGLTATFFRTYVNARQAWGVCEKEEIAGVRYWGLIYVPSSKSLLNVKFTFPQGQEDASLFFRFVKGLSFR